MSLGIIVPLLLCLLALPNASGGSSTDGSSPSCPLGQKIKLENPLRIGAWNAQKLGRSKMGKKDVVNALTKVMSRYDIMVIQEIVDSKQEVPYELLDLLNERAYLMEAEIDPNDVLNDPDYDIYKIALSDRLGTNRYKEQYAFYYRQQRVILNATFQFPDPENIFQVDPFVAVFETPLAEVERIAIIALHTSPRDATTEIDALFDVYNVVAEKFDIEDVILLGDFNAGCTYVTTNDWAKIRLRTDQRFDWLISDHMDTTTKGTSCPYDRIVVAGSTLKDALYEESAKPYYFYEDLNLDDEDFIQDISDHYPVEVLLRRHVTTTERTKTKIEIGVSVEIRTSSSAVENLKGTCLEVTRDMADAIRNKEDIVFEEEEEKKDGVGRVEKGEGVVKDKKDLNIFERFKNKFFGRDVDKVGEADKEIGDNKLGNEKVVEGDEKLVEGDEKEVDEPAEKGDTRCGRNPKVLRAENGFLLIEFRSKNIDEVIDLAEVLGEEQACVFNEQAMSILKYKLTHGVLTDASVYGEDIPFSGVTTKIMCLEGVCTVLVTKQTHVA